ncbi:MAG: type I restriction enzyme HsdR N-terminal domain-containing protein [Flavobacteriaceae bacterium]|nr:type I restriction enzyme HsdR N-terminal domain-containing protein [Flavobacteriaceae bacterium]MCY4253263.1 type I restriction enzyme HsdR N-terminal domain-containing protein [Flavobacteriaceae bacterium]
MEDALRNSVNEIKTKIIGHKRYLFDQVREKWLIDTPEERVRMQCVQYLISEVNVPKTWILIEHQIKLHNTVKRVDILVKNKNQTNFLMVECKAPSVRITPKLIEQQTTIYAKKIQCDYYMVTNGKTLPWIYTYNSKTGDYRFLKQLPLYQ